MIPSLLRRRKPKPKPSPPPPLKPKPPPPEPKPPPPKPSLPPPPPPKPKPPPPAPKPDPPPAPLPFPVPLPALGVGGLAAESNIQPGGGTSSGAGDVSEYKLDILKLKDFLSSELQRQEERLLSEFRQVGLLLSEQLRQESLLQDELRLQNSYLTQVVFGVGLVAVPLGIGLIISPPSAAEHFKHWALWAVYYAAQGAEIILGVVLVIIFKRSFEIAGHVQRRQWSQMAMFFMTLSLLPAILTVLLVGLAKYA